MHIETLPKEKQGSKPTIHNSKKYSKTLSTTETKSIKFKKPKINSMTTSMMSLPIAKNTNPNKCSHPYSMYL